MLWQLKKRLFRASSFVLLVMVASRGQTQLQTTPNPASASRVVGSVKSIHGNAIVLIPDSGSEISVSIEASTRIVRAAPGQTSLKDATPMTLQELQVGDRLLVKSSPSTDGKSIVASSAIVMKKTDVAARQDEQRQEWRRQGVGGLVKAVVPSSGAIDLSVAAFGAAKNITIHAAKATIIRRYAPDSVKFDDAKPGTLEQIKLGDQLRARGKRSEDGTELEAEEIVSGTFRNIAGTVSSVDAGQGAILVADLIANKTVTVRIGADSQVRQLPAMMARRIAMRLKGSEGDDQTAAGGGGAKGPPSGAQDLQQMLSRLPQATLADIHKGDAVLMVTTQGSANSLPTAITMLSGVQQILTASPDRSRASTLLSAWNLGSPSGGDAQ